MIYMYLVTACALVYIQPCELLYTCYLLIYLLTYMVRVMRRVSQVVKR